MREFAPTACALALCFAGSVAAQQSSPEQEALKRAKILRIIGIPGIPQSLASTLKELGATLTGEEVRIELAADVLFDLDQAELRPDALPRLEKVAVVLREYPAAPLLGQYPAVPVLIESHTDSAGSDAHNQALSDRRAASIMDWLVEHAAIDPVRLLTRGWGKSKPVQKNGRIEITVRKKS